jgi:hypothetical protein
MPSYYGTTVVRVEIPSEQFEDLQNFYKKNKSQYYNGRNDFPKWLFEAKLVELTDDVTSTTLAEINDRCIPESAPESQKTLMYADDRYGNGRNRDPDTGLFR